MSLRKIIKRLHLYIALALCLPLILQGLSGSILVIERKISEPKLLTNDSKTKPLSEIIAAASKEVPTDFKPGLVRLGEVSEIRFSKKTEQKNERLTVKIDPISLQVVEVKDPQKSLFFKIEKFHTNLLLQGSAGRNIVGIYGLVMLFMTISGIIIWWPKQGNWRRALTFKFSSSGKKFHRDLHGAAGFWVAALLFFSSFSGVYLAFPKATRGFISTFFATENFASENEIKIKETGDEAIKIDAAAALAKNEVTPEEKLIFALIPSKADQPYRFNFAPKNYQTGAPTITIFVDQYQQKILEKRDPKNFKSGEKIIAWQRSIHTAEGLGMVYKIAIFLLGFAPLLFSITGIALWLIKKSSKKMAQINN